METVGKKMINHDLSYVQFWRTWLLLIPLDSVGPQLSNYIPLYSTAVKLIQGYSPYE